MSMPTFTCPVCRNRLTIDVIFAHDGVRDAILALTKAHPEGEKLLRPLLGYVGLFAPEKTDMRYERIASLLCELSDMINTAHVSRDGTAYAAPLDYWISALNEMLKRRDNGTLRLPLSSHGYLIEIIVGYSKKADAAAESIREKQRAGYAGMGSNPLRDPVRTDAGPIRLNSTLPKTEMPQHIRDQLNEMKEKQRRQHGN